MNPIHYNHCHAHWQTSASYYLITMDVFSVIFNLPVKISRNDCKFQSEVKQITPTSVYFFS